MGHNPGYFVVELELSKTKYVVEKAGKDQRMCNYAKVIFGEAPTGEGVWKRSDKFFLLDFNF